MNHRIIQLAASAALFVALTGCGVQDTPTPGPGPADIGAPGGGTPSVPPPHGGPPPPPHGGSQCVHSPTAIDYMLETDQPLPRCVREAMKQFDDAPRGAPGQP